MDSENLYQFGGVQPTNGVASIHEWYPSLHLNNEDFNRYMNEILPNSKQVLVRDEANFVDMGYGDQLIYSGSCPSNNYNIRPCYSSIGLISSSSSISSKGMDFVSYVSNGDNCSHSSNESASFSNYDPSHQEYCHSPSTTVSKKTMASRNGAINPGTKRATTSSHKRSSHEAKKPRPVHSQSSCLLPPKVGKEKIGDRIAALHKIVAPFGKTDTATVLTEAIGYIHFLHHQIQTLSTPSEKPSRSDARHCFDRVILRKRDEEELETKQGLRSRGLCLVPFSFASYTGFGDISW